MTYRLDKATIVIGVGTIVAALLGFVKIRSNTRGEGGPAAQSAIAGLTTTPIVLLLVLGALAAFGGLLGGRPGRLLAALAGLGLLGVAGLQLLQDLFGFSLLTIGRGPMALAGGLGLGLLAIGLTPRDEPG